MASQYRSILKATSLFGGTQILQILVSLIRSKFVAILIGTEGMGLNTMYNSSLTLFITFFGLGINISVIKDLSKAHEDHDEVRFARTAQTFRYLLLLFGLLGTFCVCGMSPFLSEWTFSTSDKIANFCFLSLIVLFSLVSQGNTALLIGARRIKETALCTLLGSIVSLLIAIPFFYFLRLDGIVPGLVLSAFGDMIITYIFSRKVKYSRCRMSIVEYWTLSRSFIILGIALVLSRAFGDLRTYLVNISITNMGGLSDLGMYGAGMAISAQALSMIFASMSSDYFPRLSAVADDSKKMSQAINEQTEINLYLAVPVLSMIMLFATLIVQILLSNEFMPVNGFIRVLCLGLLFQTVTYALGYASFAKGDKNTYFWVEGVFSNILVLLTSVVFYYFWKLQGLAWAFVVSRIVYYAVIFKVDVLRYGYKKSKEVNILVGKSVFVIGILLALSYITNIYVYYTISTVFVIAVNWYFLSLLNKKTAILSTICDKINRK